MICGGLSVHYCLNFHGSHVNISDASRCSLAVHLCDERALPVSDTTNYYTTPPNDRKIYPHCTILRPEYSYRMICPIVIAATIYFRSSITEPRSRFVCQNRLSSEAINNKILAIVMKNCTR